jgi:hypothetical protein
VIAARADVQRRQLRFNGAIAVAVLAGAIAAPLIVLDVSASAGELTRDAAICAFMCAALWMLVSDRYVVTLSALLLYLALLDGFVKLKTGSSVVTLGRDVLLYAITLGAVTRAALRRVAIPPLPAAFVAVFAWVALCVAEIFNPSAISLVHAASSVRQHIEFVPLVGFGYFVLRSKERLAGLFVLLAIVAAINGVVALVQEHLTPGELAAWGPGYASEVFGSGAVSARTFVANGVAYVRPPGLGGDFGFGGILGVIALPGVLALLGYSRRSRRVTAAVWLCGPLVILAVITSQARLEIVSACIGAVAFLALTVTSRRGVALLTAAIVLAALGYVVSVAVLQGSIPNRYSSIAPSRLISTSVNYREGTLALIPTYAARYPLGAGLGSAGPAAGAGVGGGAAAGGSGGRNLDAESEFTFLEIELGIPGLVILMGIMGYAVRSGVRLRRVGDADLQRLLAAMTAVLVACWVSWVDAPDSASSPAAPFFWLAVGALAYWHSAMRTGALQMRGRGVLATIAGR